MTKRVDNIIETKGALVLGAGVAGLFTALKLAPFPCVVLADAHPGASGSSPRAQGGIAASVGRGDSWQSHAADTVAAGAGLCDPEIAALVAREAPGRIEDLVRYGAPFDRSKDGSLAVGREAAHSASRIVHVKGDRAGFAVTHALADRVLESPSITMMEGFHAIELAMEDGHVVGLFARTCSGPERRLVLLRAPAVILATGGLGALYAVSTNPPETRGEGLGMAARAGALIADPEFVQFHPTAIAVDRDPAPLATEALRGEGAILVDKTGRRIMSAIHPSAELAPRDVVARAIHREIVAGHRVFLDCRKAVGAKFAQVFPTVYEACREAGIDPSEQPIPVAPAAHYQMGGIATGNTGRASLAGLWAVGECASTGLHGANRLASNSILEALVFGARAAEDVRSSIKPRATGGALPAPSRYAAPPVPQLLRQTLTRYAGLERDAEGLRQALRIISQIERAGDHEPSLLNMTVTARMVVAGALARRESRGSHYRSDFPETDPAAKRTFMTLADADRIASAPPAEPQRARVSR
ncbi:MAG TPA: L-aspartate oxidase [Rhizomicrobium sp.]|nr:L-aspartate oxidase [Rhizomicrobium sp.]